MHIKIGDVILVPCMKMNNLSISMFTCGGDDVSFQYHWCIVQCEGYSFTLMLRGSHNVDENKASYLAHGDLVMLLPL